jgi:hypothetical protein
MTSFELNRTELRAVRDNATELSKAINQTNWKRALLNLADAADTLDAILSRADLNGISLKGKKIHKLLKDQVDDNKPGTVEPVHA